MDQAERERRKAVKQALNQQIKEGNIVYAITATHRERMFMMEQRKRCELALGAFLRRAEGWSWDLSDKEQAEIRSRVAKWMKFGVDEDSPYAEIITASRAGSAVFVATEDENTWRLKYLAERLPVWKSWGQTVLGLGACSLGVIIGEAGDLSNYSTAAKLRKRMGLAVIDGVRQGGLSKGASAEEWIEHGYNPKRRSHMFIIGECLIKASGEYRDIYLDRKEYEREAAEKEGLTVCPADSIPANEKDKYRSDGHIHRRAQRYMEKQFLAELWKQWQRKDG